VATRHRRSSARSGLLGRLSDLLARLRRYHEIAGVGEIARRYFPMNAFDGVLTTVGIITGAYFGGVREARAVVAVVAAASLSLGVSGYYGSYLSEQAERTRALRELEESTLSSLDDTDVGAAARYAAVAIALVAGFASAVGGLILCIPFLFEGALGRDAAFYVAWGLAVVELFLLGVFLARVSRGRMIVSGIKLIAAGGVAFGLSLLLNVAEI
jgi:predicted membrane protein (TIGR00267 family)